MKLTEADRELAHHESEAIRLAMKIVLAEARALGADRLVEVSSAHVVDTLQFGLGTSAFDFASVLSRSGAKVRVPTTLNTGNVDAHTPSMNGESPEEVARQMELYKTYEAMGAVPTFTCSPFQEVRLPARGEHVAWGESNAVSYINSVVGGRTLRHGHFSSIASALVGRAPYAGLHLTENRAAQLLVTLQGFDDDTFADSLFYHFLGYRVGSLAGSRVVAVDGLPKDVHVDFIKAFGAAATTSGAVSMYHLVGITPEAASVSEAFHGTVAQESLVITPQDLREVAHAVQQLEDRSPITAVALGAPHLSVEEVGRVVASLRGAPRPQVPVFLSVSRRTSQLIDDRGWGADLSAAGVRRVHDKCSYFGVVLDGVRGAVMTDSTKWADYAPNCLGSSVAIGSIEDCVTSAVEGHVTRVKRVWA